MNYKVGDSVIITDTDFPNYSKLKDRLFKIFGISEYRFIFMMDVVNKDSHICEEYQIELAESLPKKEELLQDIIKNQSIIIQLLTILTKKV